MAQSRTYTISPSIFTERSEKRSSHGHYKRGRQHGSEKKSHSRPGSHSRRDASSSTTISKPGAGHRGRRRDSEDDSAGETFPEYCMTCEKQFFPMSSDPALYCSDSCRLSDQVSSNSRSSYHGSPAAAMSPLNTFGSSMRVDTFHEGRDIIPRASPSVYSRPLSYFLPEYSSVPSSTSPDLLPHDSTSALHHHQGESPTSSRSYTALASLRKLATDLPIIPSSEPASRTSRKSTRPSSGVWNYIASKTSGSASLSSSPSHTPAGSYTSVDVESRYNQSQGSKSKYSNSKRHGMHYTYSRSVSSRDNLVGYGASFGTGMDRPLPPRTGPASYGRRSRGVDLVTPMWSEA